MKTIKIHFRRKNTKSKIELEIDKSDGACDCSNLDVLLITYPRREKQCECFQKLVKVYETTPDDTKQLMSLMQEVQEFGQPPAEIIKDIAPGIELDANGMPKLDESGIPFLGEGQEECRVM